MDHVSNHHDANKVNQSNNEWMRTNRPHQVSKLTLLNGVSFRNISGLTVVNRACSKSNYPEVSWQCLEWSWCWTSSQIAARVCISCCAQTRPPIDPAACRNVNKMVALTITFPQYQPYLLTPWLMEPGGSMSQIQEPSIIPYPEPNQPNS